jgi:hypothetical protein
MVEENFLISPLPKHSRWGQGGNGNNEGGKGCHLGRSWGQLEGGQVGHDCVDFCHERVQDAKGQYERTFNAL